MMSSKNQLTRTVKTKSSDVKEKGRFKICREGMVNT